MQEFSQTVRYAVAHTVVLICIVSSCFEGLIFYVICTREKLHIQRYYIVANLCISDILLALFYATIVEITVPVSQVRVTVTYEVVNGSLLVAIYTSLYTSALLSFDRYVAVAYSLRYSQIMTSKNTIIALLFSWISSTGLVLLIALEPTRTTKYIVYRPGALILGTLLVLIFTVFLLYVAVYTTLIRKKHIKEIRSRRIYFGVDEERLKWLSRLKQSICDTLKLNYYNAIFIVIMTVLFNLCIHFEDQIVLVILHSFVCVLTLILNPLVQGSTQTELRLELTRLIIPDNGRRQSDSNISTFSTAISLPMRSMSF